MFVKVKSKRRFRSVEKRLSSPRGQFNFPDYAKPVRLPAYTGSKKCYGRKFLFFALQIVFSSGCLAGFGYQSYQVLSFFLTYPTRMETVTGHDEISLRHPPAITVANVNKILKSYWTKVLADVNVTQAPSANWVQWRYIRDSFNKVDLKDTGHSLDSLLINSSDNRARRRATWIWSEDRGNSYVIYANYTGHSRNLVDYNPSDTSGNSYVISFQVGFQSDEYVPNGNSSIKPGAKIYVHSAHDLISFGIPEHNFKEIRIESGKKYFVSVNLEIYYYLTEPYWTNCKDYDEEFLRNGRKGPISQLTCMRDFYIFKSLNMCGCVPEFYHGTIIPLVMNDIKNQTCGSIERSEACYNKIMKTESNGKYGFSRQHCHRECKKLSYDVTIETQRVDRDFRKLDEESNDDNQRGPFMDNYNTDRSGEYGGPDSRDRGPDGRVGPPPFFGFKSSSFVYIKYASPKVTTITYEPQYKINNLIADVGGFLGLWLGVSILSVPKVFLQAILFYRAFKTGTFN